jgi:hypothetical protein
MLPLVANVELVYEDKSYVAVTIEKIEWKCFLFILATTNNSADRKHIKIKGKTHSWVGAHYSLTIK